MYISIEIHLLDYFRGVKEKFIKKMRRVCVNWRVSDVDVPLKKKKKKALYTI